MSKILMINGLRVVVQDSSVVSDTIPIQEDTRNIYNIVNISVDINNQPSEPFLRNYYCEVNDNIKMTGSMVDSDNNLIDITLPKTLKMPFVRHSNGLPTDDEVYLNVNIIDGVITASGKVERSGDWKILIHRNNEALQRIGANFKLVSNDITFLV